MQVNNKILRTIFSLVNNFLNICAFFNILIIFWGYYSKDIYYSQYYSDYVNTLLVALFVMIMSRMALNRFSIDYLRKVFFDIFLLLFIYFFKHYYLIPIILIMLRQLIVIVYIFVNKNIGNIIFIRLSKNPALFMICSFLFAIFVGTIFLLIPFATKNEGLSLIDAIFTATSAVCVTGLTVQNTISCFSIFGQVVILLLVQIGGIGIMTISGIIALILGGKFTLTSENLMQSVTGESNRQNMLGLLKGITIITFSIEFLGVLLIYFFSRNVYGSIGQGIYFSVFHSISAFCNAGFSLYSNSFIDFYDNLGLLFSLGLLITLGGLGFPVFIDIKNNKFNFKRFSLHSKIVLATSLFLVVLGTIFFYISEYNNQMRNFSFFQKLFNGFFQSVTCRTAGFNTIDMANISKSSILGSIVLMFIGASPGSTGGGIKVVSFAIVILAIISIVRGEKN